MFGAHLRAAVLDGVVDPSLTGAELAVGQMVGFTRAFDDMFAWCATQPDCPFTGDPAETWDRLLRQVDAEPLRDDAGVVTLGPARATLAVVMASYASDLWPLFFAAFAEAVDGDGELLGLLGEFYLDSADLGASVSIACTDLGAVTRAELDALTAELVEVAGDFGRASMLSGLPCEHWPVAAGTMPTGAIAAPDGTADPGGRQPGRQRHPLRVGRVGGRSARLRVCSSASTATSTPATAPAPAWTRTVDDYLVDLVGAARLTVDCPAESP